MKRIQKSIMRKNDKRQNSGFTLIELLVVIAIIGILSAIVLAALNNSRNKTLNTKIRSQLSSARTSSELYRDRVGNFGPEVTGSCTSGPVNSNLFRDSESGMILYATASNYPSPSSISLTCYSNGIHWAMSAFLVGGAEGGSTYWCVDSRGNSKGRTGPAVAQTLTLGC